MIDVKEVNDEEETVTLVIGDREREYFFDHDDQLRHNEINFGRRGKLPPEVIKRAARKAFAILNKIQNNKKPA